MRLDHVQMAIPRDGEDTARAFWTQIMGFTEVEKPGPLQGRGGLWLTRDGINLHLGVDDPFTPARKAHPCFAVDDLDALLAEIEAAGITPAWDTKLPDIRRFFISDPFGNRIEVMAEPAGQQGG